jgi:hypothetical protein
MSLERVARYKPGENITVAATVAGGIIVAGRFIAVTGINKRRGYDGAHCSAGDERPFGVSQRSTMDPATEDVNSTELLTECVRSNAVARVEAGEEIDATPPVDVAVGAGGKAIVADVAVAAFLKTGVVGNNNAITWTAREAGVDGDNLTITLQNTGKEKALSVDVNGNDIVVTLATNGVGAGEVTSTAAQVEAAVLAHDTASQLVTTANTAGSSGAGVVVAVAKTNLAGGEEGTAGAVAVGKALTSAAAAGDIIEVDLY